MVCASFFLRLSSLHIHVSNSALGLMNQAQPNTLSTLSPMKRSTVFTSDAVTQGIRVQVVARYDPSRSNPHQNQWFFLYTITLTNEGSITTQLISRHWIITNANGKVEEVKGPGVVGEQPILAPGQSFEYTSGCPLTTSFGTMHGTYQMITAKGERFDATIAPFTLSEPHALH
jgi:ApaG protein